MSKERLEEIKKLFDRYWTSEEPSEQLDLSIDLLQDHVGYLIERVQELENHDGIHRAQIKYLQDKNRHYREAIEKALSIATPSTLYSADCSDVEVILREELEGDPND